MDEEEWLACVRPEPMLRFLLGTSGRVQDKESFPKCRGSDRKLRLFACACYHRISHLLPSAIAAAAVEVALGFADGVATGLELQQAEAGIMAPLTPLERQLRGSDRRSPTYEALALAVQVVRTMAPKAAYYASSNAYHSFALLSNPRAASESAYSRDQFSEGRAQTDLLRCIFGDLFRPVTISAAVLAWSDGTVRRLAQGIYDERAFDDMPILGDALEEVGCTDEAILSHCRRPGPHVRGCWVVDLLLGKS